MRISNRRDFLRNTALGGLGLLAASGLGAAEGLAGTDGRRPNVVFILADDLGWGDLACYGNTIAKTPNIDRLAKQGIRFSNFYVNGPVCSPTRVGFMTGRFPSCLRIHSHFATPELNAKRGMPQALDPAVTTIADCLKEAGYVTGHFGKWHMGDIDPKEYGFDEHRVFNRGGVSGWQGEPNFWRRSSELIADEAVRFVEAHRDEPFYVNVWSLHPHAPLDPSEEQMAPYAKLQSDRVTGKFTTPFGVFYGCVTELDRHIGRLLDKLDELGLAENTIVLFSSDNGPEDIHLVETAHSGVGSAGPFRGRKRSLYEGGIRTPFIIRWPGRVPAGLVDNTTVLSGVDFLPSVCRLAGVAAPEGLQQDGEDMSPALLGKPRERRKSLLWERRFIVIGDPIHKSPMMAIREGRWKLLMNPDRSRVELYDIPNDPSEVDNVAEKHRGVVKRLSKRLMRWHASLPESPIEKEAGSNTYPWPK